MLEIINPFRIYDVGVNSRRISENFHLAQNVIILRDFYSVGLELMLSCYLLKRHLV
jgi:hypothetical protein